MGDDDVLRAVNDAWEHSHGGGEGVVDVVDEDGRVCAFIPVDQRRVDGEFDVCPVKVDGGALREVLEASGDYCA